MRNSSKHRTAWMLGAVALSLCLQSLTGCATSSAPCEKVQTPAEWREPQLPAAKDFSKEVHQLLLDVQTYFSETPRFTTRSQSQ